ncbi:MAG: site-specific DNA-methyltransferase [Candidatus Limnocylindrales bacterium]
MTTELPARAPLYRTDLGEMWVGDSLEALSQIPTGSVQAIITSPPFALSTPKKYGNKGQDEYAAWFLPFAREAYRVIRDDGSLVLEVGGSWQRGRPIRSTYHLELLIALVSDIGFQLAQEFYGYNRAKIPGPAEWVNVRRERVKDAVTPIWWLSKTDHPKADNRRVLRPYGPDMRVLFEKGYNHGPRPSGHRVGNGFGADRGGAIPSNLLAIAHTRSRGDTYATYCRSMGLPIHPARFPREIPEFFIRFLTEPGDLILDPFAGSNITGASAEELGRKWIAIEIREEYARGSRGRFLSAIDG